MAALGARAPRRATMSPMLRTDPDPMPQPPAQPDLHDCCGSGCNPCVFDLYDAALERYREALRAWRERHPGEEPDAPAG